MVKTSPKIGHKNLRRSLGFHRSLQQKQLFFLASSKNSIFFFRKEAYFCFQESDMKPFEGFFFRILKNNGNY